MDPNLGRKKAERRLRGLRESLRAQLCAPGPGSSAASRRLLPWRRALRRVAAPPGTSISRFMNHRVPAHKRYQPTEYEHAANCATHALWIIPSILGSSNLYFLSDDDWETISAWIYGLGLCGLFVVSTVFHTISWKKSHLRMVEHCLHMFDRMVIYFFIAASYAPWLNLRELGPWASHMRWLVWIMASVGTIYVFFFHERYKLVELLCYVIMGFFPALVLLSMALDLLQSVSPAVEGRKRRSSGQSLLWVSIPVCALGVWGGEGRALGTQMSAPSSWPPLRLSHARTIRRRGCHAPGSQGGGRKSSLTLQALQQLLLS
ncbi:monocyte to macrophage differentiation factor 2 isoform X3 [Halichoerus grypus]|uniref:ras-associating and dilute domain-containing protein isoform X8 n=1 Tax=Halichoerus grypus TaxID=9711 RepID=UPI001658E3A1|nr:ras-associating and dilute domain-containing protein isoform X8 [Halichoerus grypus]